MARLDSAACGLALLGALAGCGSTISQPIMYDDDAPFSADHGRSDLGVDPLWRDAHATLVEVSMRCEDRREELGHTVDGTRRIRTASYVAALIAGGRSSARPEEVPGQRPVSGVDPLGRRIALADSDARRTAEAMNDALDEASDWLTSRRDVPQWSDEDEQAWSAHEAKLAELCPE
jgi:hypothetical protein